MFVLVWLGGPALLGAALGAALAKGWLRTYGLFGLGLVIGFGVVLAAYLSSAPDAEHDSSGCSNCQQFWGRWWEPKWVFFLTGTGFFVYLIGIGVGAGGRNLLEDLRRRDAA
jgi:hypothetical protein